MNFIAINNKYIIFKDFNAFKNSIPRSIQITQNQKSDSGLKLRTILVLSQIDFFLYFLKNELKKR